MPYPEEQMKTEMEQCTSKNGAKQSFGEGLNRLTQSRAKSRSKEIGMFFPFTPIPPEKVHIFIKFPLPGL